MSILLQPDVILLLVVVMLGAAAISLMTTRK